jgi:hypothetical protein
MHAGGISAALLVPVNSGVTHASFNMAQDRLAQAVKKAPRQIISDQKWEGATWMSAEDLSKKRQRVVAEGDADDAEDDAAEDDGGTAAKRPKKPATAPVDADDVDAATGRSKDKDVVPSRYEWAWDDAAGAWVSQERPRIPISGAFFAFSRVPAKQVELLNTILNQEACPIDANFLRTELVPRLNRKHKVSLRLLDWLVVDYARERNVAYRQFVPVLNREVIVIVHQLYCSLRDRWRRRRFDCFRRRHRIYFDLDGKTYSTTVAQLHFFFVAKMYGFLEFAAANWGAIDAHMKRTLTETAEAKQRARVLKKTYRRRPLVKKATSQVFVSDVPFCLSFDPEPPAAATHPAPPPG